MSFIFMKSPFGTLRLGLLILWLFALQQQAHAQDAVPVVKEEYISATDVITVEKDGSYTVEWQTTRRLLDASWLWLQPRMSGIGLLAARTAQPMLPVSKNWRSPA